MDPVAVAQSHPSAASFERSVLDGLARDVGADAAFFAVPGATPTALALDPLRVAEVLADPRVVRETAPLRSAALAARGVATDTDVLGDARERCAYFRTLAAPVRGRHSLLAFLRVRGEVTGALMLGRCGQGARGFSEGEIARVAALLPTLAIAHASYARRALPAGLSARERDVLDYLCLGYTNREIAAALGTSPNTVRNQVVSLFAKLGATTRAEAVALARG